MHRCHDRLAFQANNLLSDLSTGMIGEVHFVDSGYNVTAMPQPDALHDAASKDAAQ